MNTKYKDFYTNLTYFFTYHMLLGECNNFLDGTRSTLLERNSVESLVHVNRVITSDDLVNSALLSVGHCKRFCAQVCFRVIQSFVCLKCDGVFC